MRPPAFWSNDPSRPGLAARLLAPLAALQAALTARRVARPPAHRAAVPVICVGNINAGGTGKTPTVIALVQALASGGIAAHVVSRGYGGSLPGPVRVDERRHSAAEVGDEPLLLSAFAPVWVARDRAAGVRAAEAAGAQAVILDDGFQNPSVAKSLSIVVVDAAAGFGNGRCIPAGPLREPVARGLSRADAVLTIGSAEAQAAFAARWRTAIGQLPWLRGELRPLPTGMPWAGLRVLAFAGIGRPDKMFATLRGLGAVIVRAVPLDDHQPLSPALLQRLESDARQANARLVTTEKDAMRLPPGMRGRILTLPVRLEMEDPAALAALLDRVIPR